MKQTGTHLLSPPPLHSSYASNGLGNAISLSLSHTGEKRNKGE